MKQCLTRNGGPPSTRCVVTTTLPDALAVYGALALREGDELEDGVAHAVLAPARPKGYANGDLRILARRPEELVLLGRGAERLAARLVELGATPRYVRELDLARTLTGAISPFSALASLMGADVPVPATTSLSSSTAEHTADNGGFPPGRQDCGDEGRDDEQRIERRSATRRR